MTISITGSTSRRDLTSSSKQTESRHNFVAGLFFCCCNGGSDEPHRRASQDAGSQSRVLVMRAPRSTPSSRALGCPSGPSVTDQAARRLQQGNADAIAVLYERVTPAIYTYAALRIGERWVAPDDVVAETWRRVLVNAASFDPSRPFRAWVFGFVQNVVRESQRAIARLHTAAGNATSGDPMEDVPASITSAVTRAAQSEDLATFLRWARQALSDYEREILLLRGIQGREISDVATVLGRTVRAVTACWARLLKKLADRRVPPGVVPSPETAS